MKLTNRINYWGCCVFGLAVLLLPIMGGDCDDDGGDSGVLSIIVAVFDLVIGIIRAAD